jgi:hypothetical protein
MRNNKRPQKKSTRTAQYKRSDRPILIKHNNTTYSGRITDAGQSVFLETPKIPIEMLNAREFE